MPQCRGNYRKDIVFLCLIRLKWNWQSASRALSLAPEMVRFGKNGSDVTAGAVRAAPRLPGVIALHVVATTGGRIGISAVLLATRVFQRQFEH